MKSEITSFTVRGLRNGSLVHVHWDHGTITGDPPTVDLLLVEAELAGVAVGDRLLERAGMTPGTVSPLIDAASAVTFICSAIDRVTEVTPDSLRHLAGLGPA